MNRWSAELECNRYGLTMARVDNMRTFAIVGRLLEKLVLAKKLKDTWCKLKQNYIMILRRILCRIQTVGFIRLASRLV